MPFTCNGDREYCFVDVELTMPSTCCGQAEGGRNARKVAGALLLIRDGLVDVMCVVLVCFIVIANANCLLLVCLNYAPSLLNRVGLAPGDSQG